MQRINPIYSPLSYLNTKSVFQQEKDKKYVMGFQRNTGIERIEYNKKNLFEVIESNFFVDIELFYEFRNHPDVSNSFENYEKFMKKRNKIELKNEFGDVIKIIKDRNEDIRTEQQKNCSYYQVKSRSNGGIIHDLKKKSIERKEIAKQNSYVSDNNKREGGGIITSEGLDEEENITSSIQRTSKRAFNSRKKMQEKLKKIQNSEDKLDQEYFDLFFKYQLETFGTPMINESPSNYPHHNESILLTFNQKNDEKRNSKMNDFNEERLKKHITSELESQIFSEKYKNNLLEDTSFTLNDRTTNDIIDLNYNVPRLLLGRYYLKKQKEWNSCMKFILLPFVPFVILLKRKKLITLNQKEESNETTTNISSMFDRLEREMIYNENTELTFSFENRKLNNLNLRENQFKYSVLIALLLRLFVAHEEIHLLKEEIISLEKSKELEKISLYKRIILKWQLFIDGHINLCRYIKEYNKYKDIDLLFSERNETHIAMCALKQYCPSDRDFAYGGNLPNLSSCLFAGNFWFDVRPKHKCATLQHALIHLFGSKTKPHKCQIRNFPEILEKYLKSFPILNDFYRELIRVSLLGNYEHALNRPHFELRIKLYDILQENSISREEFFDWMLKNDALVFHVTKEFYLYNQQFDMVINDIMEKTVSSWVLIQQVIINTMETTRILLNIDAVFRMTEYRYRHQNEVELLGDQNIMILTDQRTPIIYIDDKVFSSPPKIGVIFDSIRGRLRALHDQSNPYIFKLQKGSYLDVICSFLEVFFESKIMKPSSSDGIAIHSSESQIDQNLLNDIHLVARDIVYQHHIGSLKDGKVPTRYLGMFGMSKDGINSFRKLEYLYEETDLPDNAILKYVNNFYKHNNMDFFIYHSYIRAIMQYRSNRYHFLCYNIYDAQKKAIRMKKMKMPWEELKEEDDIYFYCPCCKRFKTPICDINIAVTVKNVYAQAFEKVIYNIEDGKLYCSKKPAPKDKNKKDGKEEKIDEEEEEEEEEDEEEEDDYIDDEEDGLFTKSLRNNSTKTCSETELVPVHMLGKLIQLDKHYWLLCTICARPMKFTGSCFGELGITCGLHGVGFSSIERYISEPTHVQSSSLEYRIQFESEFQKPIQRKLSTLDQKNILEIFLQKNQPQNFVSHPKNRHRACYYCETPIVFLDSNNSSIKSTARNIANHVYIFEDVPRKQGKKHNPKIVSAFFCGSDYDKISNRLFHNLLITRSELLKRMASIYERKSMYQFTRHPSHYY